MATSLSPDPPPAPAGPRVGELATGEQLLLWALRKRLEGTAQLPALRRGFRLVDRGIHERDVSIGTESGPWIGLQSGPLCG